MAVLAAGMLLLASFQPEDPVVSAAAAANVDATLLTEALLTVGEPDPLEYLHHTGELRRPAPALNLAVERRLDCISWYESRHTPSAYNRTSGASGQFQFLLSTWRTTPQGKAGLSVFDPVAARQAARWMLSQGRAREWVPVQRGLC